VARKLILLVSEREREREREREERERETEKEFNLIEFLFRIVYSRTEKSLWGAQPAL
jgi:hypothetical protein